MINDNDILTKLSLAKKVYSGDKSNICLIVTDDNTQAKINLNEHTPIEKYISIVKSELLNMDLSEGYSLTIKELNNS
jgi:hypothetical protein